MKLKTEKAVSILLTTTLLLGMLLIAIPFTKAAGEPIFATRRVSRLGQSGIVPKAPWDVYSGPSPKSGAYAPSVRMYLWRQ